MLHGVVVKHAVFKVASTSHHFVFVVRSGYSSGPDGDLVVDQGHGRLQVLLGRVDGFNQEKASGEVDEREIIQCGLFAA